jgi:hypothetical protein
MLLKLQKRGVERPLVDGELVGADLLNPSGDRVSMQWPHRVERLQNDEVKRAVEDVRLVGRHVLEVYSYDVLSVNRSRPNLLKMGVLCERRFARARGQGPQATSATPSEVLKGPMRPRLLSQWWAHLAHFKFTRINTTPTFLRKKIEDLYALAEFLCEAPVVSLRKALVVATRPALPRRL